VVERTELIFLTGATGYVGRRLAAELIRRGHAVTVLVRKGSEAKAAAGCAVVVGDALDAASYRDQVPKGCTFVHLVGVAHPSPAKGAQFRAIDLVSIQAADSQTLVRAGPRPLVAHRDKARVLAYGNVPQHARIRPQIVSSLTSVSMSCARNIWLKIRPGQW